MIRKTFFIVICLSLALESGLAQTFIKTSDLFERKTEDEEAGHLNIIQNPAIDSLISRYILGNKILAQENLHMGMNGYRIQIYASSNINARDESNKANALFLSKFSDIKSYQLFAEPGYFKIRVGDFRTRAEATRLFLIISKEFPDSYIVPDFIDFPDLNTK